MALIYKPQSPSTTPTPFPISLLPPPHFMGELPPSPLPPYAVNAANPNDQYFTKKAVAQVCYSSLVEVAAAYNLCLNRHTFLEPSAGEGCFTNLLPRPRVSLDIAPIHKETKKADFLEWTPEPKKRYVVVGNPPFGVRGATALAFLNRAAQFADVVAFILPMTFASMGKGGAMTRVDSRLSLLHSEELGADAFYEAHSGADRAINTVWQVWAAANPRIPRPAPPDCSEYVDIRTVSTIPNRRCGLAHMDEYAFFLPRDFYPGRTPAIVKNFAEAKYKCAYGVIIKKDKARVRAAFLAADWARHSARATNHCRHISIRHILAVLAEAGFARGAGE